MQFSAIRRYYSFVHNSDGIGAYMVLNVIIIRFFVTVLLDLASFHGNSLTGDVGFLCATIGDDAEIVAYCLQSFNVLTCTEACCAKTHVLCDDF